MDHHARSVHDCWLIARRHAEHYQHELNKALHERGHINYSRAATCRAARDAADKIALEIRFGKNGGHK